MTDSDVHVDEDVRQLAAVVVRALIYVVRWLVRRYGLNHLIKSDQI